MGGGGERWWGLDMSGAYLREALVYVAELIIASAALSLNRTPGKWRCRWGIEMSDSSGDNSPSRAFSAGHYRLDRVALLREGHRKARPKPIIVATSRRGDVPEEVRRPSLRPRWCRY